MEDIVAAILGTVKCIVTPAFGCLEYCKTFEDDVEELRERVRDLNSIKIDVKTVVECSRKPVREEVEEWLRAVQRINEGIEAVEEELTKVSCFSRAELGNLVRLRIKEVKEIFQRGTLIIDRPPTIGLALPTERLGGEDTVMQKIWKSLMSSEIGMIGVCGMAGVGKTTIMRHVQNELVKSSSFHKVIWVTVSGHTNVESLQRQIAQSMKVSLPENEGEGLWASRLRDIMIEGKYVLILDDVWENISLECIGIPSPTRENGCKVVITSRQMEVCNLLCCDTIVQVPPLTEQDSLNLFLNKVGLDILQVPPDLERILKLIVKKCYGIPLAIATVAGSLRGVDDILEWRNALHQSREVEGMSEDPIISLLKISFDRLHDSQLQNCFLSCSLYPEGCKINRDELIEYWMDGELIEEERSRLGTKVKAHAILNKLVNHCLLENAYGEGFVRMHDALRKLALDIKAVGTDRFLVRAQMGLMGMPICHEWTEDLEKVSLMENGISNIPPNMSPKCPKLSTLMLQNNIRLKHIPEPFLTNMPALCFLNLSGTGIKALPNSICNLKNLTSLILRECRRLKYVPSLANLKTLKKLDLYEAGIEVVPEGIEMLVNLKYLDLYCQNLVELPTGIISMLTRLQHFVIYWKSTTLKTKGEEVARLIELETFKGQLYDLQDFNNYVKSNHFARVSNYLLVVGTDKKSREFMGEDCSRRVCLRGSEIGGKDFVELPDDLEELNICQCHNVRSLNESSISLQNTSELRSCSIHNCEGIECLIDTVSSLSSSIGNLEILALSELPNLRVLVKVEGTAASVWHAPKLYSNFSNLKTFYVSGCSNMKRLFPFDMLQDLQNLQDVTVENCEEMEEIIASVEEAELEIPASPTFTLPKLSQLVLVSLPVVTRICSKTGVLVCNSLKSIQILRCPKLNRIPFVGSKQPLPPALKVINTELEWWNSLLWDDPIRGDALRPFVQPLDQPQRKASEKLLRSTGSASF